MLAAAHVGRSALGRVAGATDLSTYADQKHCMIRNLKGQINLPPHTLVPQLGTLRPSWTWFVVRADESGSAPTFVRPERESGLRCGDWGGECDLKL